MDAERLYIHSDSRKVTFMPLWLRMGPFGVSSRGRVGVRMGPLSWYGGGRRRKRRAKSSGGSWLAAFLLLGLIGLAVEHWQYTVPIAVVVVPLLIWATRTNSKKAAARHQAWLDGPAPRMTFPGRFTQNWFASNGPRLHPKQVPILFTELRDRGWSNEEIQRRVAPHIRRP